MFDPADVQVAYVIAHFWEGGARCFGGGFPWDAVVVSGAGAFLLNRGLHPPLP